MDIQRLRFDPIDRTQLILLTQLSPAKRLQAMLHARELAVGLIRGKLRHRHPELPSSALNLKVLEEIARVQKIRPGP
ncbi:MAG TPA: hypothetical protein G4N96_01830 [Chloroflexi bacterium]|nr:hypothetical protein [Chloroflexota bacterium]